MEGFAIALAGIIAFMLVSSGTAKFTTRIEALTVIAVLSARAICAVAIFVGTLYLVLR